MVPGTKTIVEVMQSFVESRLNDVHTSIPGRIQSYDDSTGLASVEPLVKISRVNQDNTVSIIEIPIIDNVPVCILGSTDFILKFPIKKGTGVAIFFSEVAIGNFINGGNSVVDPEDAAQFSLTDAFCILGLWGKSTFPTGTPTIEVTTSGGINFLQGTQSFTKGDELETQLNSFLDTVGAITPGDQVTNAIALATIKAAAIAFRAQTVNIKSTKIKGE